MNRTSDQLLADLKRVKRRISRIESALRSEDERELQIERRRAARLKFVVGGDVVGRTDRGELDAKAVLEGAYMRARTRDQELFLDPVRVEGATATTPPSDATESRAQGDK